MAVRITDYMRFQGLTSQYQLLLAEQLKVQKQVSSGKKILVPEDDPSGAARAQLFHQEKAALEQNARNINEALSWNQSTSSLITQTIHSLQRAMELAISGGDGSKAPSDLEAMSFEVNQLLEHLVLLGSESHRGRYILSGTMTDRPAFESDRDADGRIVSVDYAGNEEVRRTEVARDRVVAYNLLGSNEFGGEYGLFRDTEADVDVFETLINFRDALIAGDTEVITQESVGELMTAIDHLTQGQAVLGGVQSRLLNAIAMNEDHAEDIAGNLSKIEETDIAEAAIRLASLSASYQAALAIGAKIMQNSLLDYIR
jgi:flagellar hook-associated protein 3 FlgL